SSGRDGDLFRSALPVLDRVYQEVAHDALDAARVDVGVARAAGPGDGDGRPGALGERGGELHGVGDDVLQVAPLDVEDRRAGVEPADLQQVGEHLLEAVDLRLEQLGRAPHGGVEAVPVGVEHLAGHADRRQRGTQLVGDVGDE